VAKGRAATAVLNVITLACAHESRVFRIGRTARGSRARVLVARGTSTLSTRPTLARVDVREGLSQAAEFDIVSVAEADARVTADNQSTKMGRR